MCRIRVLFVKNWRDTPFQSYGPINCQMQVEMVTRTCKNTRYNCLVYRIMA